MTLNEKYKKPIPQYAYELDGWKEVKIIECNEKMVEISNINKRIVVSPLYFERKQRGSIQKTYVRKSIAKMLLKALKILPKEYIFLVWDAYRTIELQQTFFDEQYINVKIEHPEMTFDELIQETQKFVSLPSYDANSPAPHNTGGAIDLTIANKDGKSINMGFVLDEFQENSYTRYFEEKLEKGEKLNDEEYEALINRRILYNILKEVGFESYPYECWHKSFGDQMATKLKNNNNAIYGGYNMKEREGFDYEN